MSELRPGERVECVYRFNPERCNGYEVVVRGIVGMVAGSRIWVSLLEDIPLPSMMTKGEVVPFEAADVRRRSLLELLVEEE